MAADKAAAAVDAEVDAEEVDILAGMGLSAEEAAAAAGKVQAIQRGKLARWQLAASQAVHLSLSIGISAPAPTPGARRTRVICRAKG